MSWRRVAVGAAVVFVVAILTFGLVTWRQLSHARQELATARSTLEGIASRPELLRTGEGRAKAIADIDHAVAGVDAADKTLRGSGALSLADAIPGLRAQRTGLLMLVGDARQGAAAGRALLGRIDAVATSARLVHGTVPLAQISELEGPVRATGVEFGRLVRSPAGLWGPLADARRKFDTTAARNSQRLLGAADSVHVNRTFLGADAPRRYLLAFQNNAEMRDQGMVLSYAVIDVAAGRIRFERGGSITALALSRPVNVTTPPGTQAVFGSTLPTKLWQSVNATADFSWSGQVMAAMYEQARGSPVDGVIAIDIRGLAGLLRVLGPVSVDGLSQPLTEANATEILLHDLYQHSNADAAGSSREDKVQGNATQAIVDRLTQGDFDALSLGRDLGDAVAGGHLRLWSKVPSEERDFERVGLGGGPAVTEADRTFHLAVQNRTATKLDYYVRPRVEQRIQLTPAGDAIVRTKITVRNEAPVNAAPSVQLGPDGEVTHRAGDYIASVCWWGPAGSSQEDAAAESGLNLTQYLQNVAAGQQAERTILTVIPKAVRNGKLELRYLPQPRLDPAELTVTLDAPGWSVDGKRVQALRWDRTLRLTWSLTH